MHTQLSHHKEGKRTKHLLEINTQKERTKKHRYILCIASERNANYDRFIISSKQCVQLIQQNASTHAHANINVACKCYIVHGIICIVPACNIFKIANRLLDLSALCTNVIYSDSCLVNVYIGTDTTVEKNG